MVDAAALLEAERAGDVLGGNAIMMDAFYTDVRADLADWRVSRGLPADPVKAFADSGYLEQVSTDRVGGTAAGWGA
jgi:L-rhamnose isomerase/sugar isomerase